MTVRAWLTRIHRWTGLALLVFLVTVGFTGALLPFQGDIQEWLAPTQKVIVRPPSPDAKPLDWLALRRIAIAESGGAVDSMGLWPLPGTGNEPAVIGVAPREGQPALGYDALKLDPWTGKVLGREGGGLPPPFAARIMPFLYSLHTSLASGDWGAWLLGVAAFFWTIDCFVGFYLTLPHAPRGWWRHWRRAWKVRLPARGAFRLNFDLHRAAGLWFWPMLFLFAWSSVAMNLHQVYDPIVRSIFDYRGYQEPPPAPVTMQAIPDFEAALHTARRAVRERGRHHGFVVERERDFSLDRKTGQMGYIVRTDRDKTRLDYANSYFTLDARTGRILSENLPTGERGAETFTYWITVLHTAGVGGLPFRALVSVTGVAIVVLSITGVVIWTKKRKARRSRVLRTKLALKRDTALEAAE